jgi:DNA recombination protein RmuC
MDSLSLTISIITILLLIFGIVYLIFYLPKSQEKLLKLRLDSLSSQQKETNQQQNNDYFNKLTSLIEQQEKLLKLRLEQLEKDLKNNKEVLSNQQKEINEQQEKLLKLRLDSLSSQQKEASKKQEELLKLRLDSLSSQQKEASKKQEELLKLRLDSLGQELKTSKESLGKINNLLLAPFERGRLGNIQLDRLLSLYLPKDDKIYQLEYTLKKKTEKGEGLRPDAVVFGVDQKSNLAIDSKFPLDNYIASSQENLSEQEKEERIKKFKENIKIHIKKVAHYISKDDDIQNVIMFVPSEVIFAKINEQSYYDIIETALANKVYLCSPVTLAIIVNQVLWANKILEQYRTMDQVLGQLQTFWTDFGRWQDRWNKILKKVDESTKAIQAFNISVDKISKHGEKIKELKVIPQLDEKREKIPIIPSKEEN